MAKRVYFAFHYQDVVDFRANVVRNHNALQGVQQAGYYDHSIWEESKKKGDVALKRMINAELEGSTVTAVLIGSQTYIRRWVRYELVKSVARGNRVLGIHVNTVPGKDSMTKTPGPDPLQYLGLLVSEDGKTGRPTVWDQGKWIYYTDVDSFPLNEQPASLRGTNVQLTHWFKTYDWINDSGYANFSSWIG